MKLTTLAILAFCSNVMAEDYFNFPTIKAEFSNIESCREWFGQKEITYADKVVKSESGCELIKGSYHPKRGSSRDKIIGKVVLDSLR